MAEDERKAELTAALARSRTHLTGHWHGLRRDLDFAARARRSFARHPAVWIGGAALLGLFIARLPPRQKKSAPPARKKAESTVEKVEKAGLLLVALKFAFSVARPALTAWITRRAADYFDAENRGGPARR
jgi:hypothetical protein